MRGTVRMTARLLQSSGTGARVVTTRAPIVLMAPTDARSSVPRWVPLSLLMSRSIDRLAWTVGAVRDDGVWEPSTATPAGRMP
jgi:hypothetical protein